MGQPRRDMLIYRNDQEIRRGPMNFDPMKQPYHSDRITLAARNGVVCTSNALASQAGLDMLKKGGNAIDAAIATAACLTVVEPTANGIGADNFAIVWLDNELYGMNSNGCSPYGISLDKVKKDNEKMPVHGWTPVTVPGAPKGWAELNQRFGKLSLLECLSPAIDYAQNGFPVAANVAKMWKRAYEYNLKLYRDRSEFDEWFRTFTFDGKAPEPFQMITLPNHARTLRLIAESNGESFYLGELADRIDEDSKRHGGYLRKRDLEDFEPSWVSPLSVSYRGYDVVELPPSGQGMVALMALNVLNNYEVKERNSAYYHTMFEAMKIGFADGMHYITDPSLMELDPAALLSPAYGEKRFGQIGAKAEEFSQDDPYQSGTVYLCTADKYGNMVSMIQSNYMGFGSGIVVKDTGIALQNRGADFKLDASCANVLAPHKRTFHTIIPGMLMKDNDCLGVFGVMGGFMQPQGHVQVVSNLIDFNLNPQMALDCPRWQWVRGKQFVIEEDFDQNIAGELIQKGHEISVAADNSTFGRGQIILKMDTGAYAAGTESRTDGNIALY